MIDNKLERESQYIRTQSVTVLSEQTYQSALNRNLVQGEIPTNPADLTLSSGPVLTLPDTEPSFQFVSEVKQDAKTQIISDDKEHTYEYVRTLVKQGKILELSYLEQSDATWKSYLFNLPKGTMKFLLNAQLDTLPTKANLKQWGKRTSENCFCGKKQTLNHILNCCKRALDDGRYTFRHDSILAYISNCLDREKFVVYVDIEGSKTAAGGTMPPEAAVTNLKPDIVILDRKTKTLSIFELTVPNESRIEVSHNLKAEKYQHFLTDVTQFKPFVIPFEIGSVSGHISLENKPRIAKIHKFCKPNIKLKNFMQNISAISVLSSYYIFNCRNTELWDTPNFIPAPFKQ